MDRFFLIKPIDLVLTKGICGREATDEGPSARETAWYAVSSEVGERQRRTDTGCEPVISSTSGSKRAAFSYARD